MPDTRIADLWDTMELADRVQLLLTAGMTLCDIRRGAAVTASWCAIDPTVRRRVALRIENRVDMKSVHHAASRCALR